MVTHRAMSAGEDTGVNLTVDLCGIPLATPLIPAAGTLSKEGLGEVKGVYGAMLPKTVTPRPRVGNPPPRIAEVSSGMVNSIGLQNPGLDRFLEDLDDYDVGLPLFLSVAADTVGEFAAMCERLANDERIAAVELNLSCPNVEHGGVQFCAGRGAVREVVEACRGSLSEKPLFVKLTNEGIVSNAMAAEEAGADALTVINTIPALVVDSREREVFLRGGLSGPAIKPVALRAIYEVSRAVRVPVIGVGGVTSGTDIVEFMLAGAAAVQVGAGSFVREPREMLEEFVAYLRENGLRIRDLKGALAEL
ncbi:MAG: Dihydroorotate dehydrogenase (NAD(+)), catalytic subunit [uncultured Rubrobacteraceae bacterium]|uniref:Dihydroorotate dehydrogenase n=1 Tax=uncultured Rubrobacteraceae bacterium TaxID=349277 RepID=A0A6J4QNH3_9ACTN|nr:MAG: Dihydroorotate dehydrogenase (NAD(+)), catalytic subunit [uncultured Rubrobacteraceae bacterium]